MTKTRVSFIFAADTDANFALHSALSGGERDVGKLKEAVQQASGNGDRAAFTELVKYENDGEKKGRKRDLEPY